jgi:hypothetical protein
MALFVQGGKDACQGDISGGPYVDDIVKQEGRLVVVGVVSAGIKKQKGAQNLENLTKNVDLPMGPQFDKTALNA